VRPVPISAAAIAPKVSCGGSRKRRPPPGNEELGRHGSCDADHANDVFATSQQKDPMKARDLTVADRMTRTPELIGSEQPVSAAYALMRSNEIRHLPVLNAGKLVGVVSLRDLHFIEAFRDVDLDSLRVEVAMGRDLYAVEPKTPLKQVASEMAERKLGSVVVIEGNEIVGVFTTLDALDTLVGVLADQ
jgi:acetoin utilization protein AcuB